MVNAAAQVAVAREKFFRRVWIHADKQGKHVVGHKNYDPTSLKSIFSHHDPERLLRQHAGKGVPLMELEVGMGYKEALEFGEYIGEYHDIKGNLKIPTTRGTIHYYKNGGAHIAPAAPYVVG